jgi:hypothetical protein
MPTRNPVAQIIFSDEREYAEFRERARRNNRSVSNELSAMLGMPELKHGGARPKGRKRNSSAGGIFEKMIQILNGKK